MENFDETVRRLWNEGLSYTRIADYLGGGKSRSAIAGVLRRLRASGAQVADRPNLPGRGWQRDTTALKAAGTPRPRGKQSVPRPTPLAAGEARVGGGLDRSAFALSAATETSVRLMDVREGQCRWPLGEPGSDEFRFCGCEVAHGSYCAAHARKAFQPNSARRDRKNGEPAGGLALGTFQRGHKADAGGIMDHWQ